jgi:hypothetical protein
MKVHLSELQNNIANKLFDCPFFVDRTSWKGLLQPNKVKGIFIKHFLEVVLKKISSNFLKGWTSSFAI